MVGTFPLSEILNGKHIATFSKRCYIFIKNVVICLSKTKRKNGGNFSTQRNFEWEKDKNFVETYSDVFENVAICLSKMSLFVSPKFFGLNGGSSLKTIAMFLENIAINKKYATKIVLFVAF